MAAQLSWDLHVHPGPSSVPRWGSGAEIQAAAAAAGVEGFVWKSHEHHTARDCAALAAKSPRAIGSASLNAWATPDSVAAAIADGARWVWGPTHDRGQIGWERPLPEAWPAYRDLLRTSAGALVLGTGHLAADGRRAFAELAAEAPHLRCSITHSLYLGAGEVTALRDLGCLFEVDLYTATHPIKGRPRVDLASGIKALRDRGATVYLTTDCGQRDVGNPYVFSLATLGTLEREIGEVTLHEIASANPQRIGAHVLAVTG